MVIKKKNLKKHVDKNRHSAFNAGGRHNSSMPKDHGRQQSKQRLSSDSCEFFSIIERLKSMRMDSGIGEKIGFITMLASGVAMAEDVSKGK